MQRKCDRDAMWLIKSQFRMRYFVVNNSGLERVAIMKMNKMEQQRMKQKMEVEKIERAK